MESKGYFDEVASRWDEMRQAFFSDGVREKAYAAAELEEGMEAADLGAGTGFITEGLLRYRLKRIIAVDQSESMLAEIERKFDRPEVECRQGTADHLPLADEAIDRAFANMYLHHVPNPAAAIKEMARILRPGGCLVITDLDEHTYEFLRTEQYDIWLGFKREDITRWLQEAGLKNVVVDCVGENCCSPSNCGCAEAQVSIFIARGDK
jgi:ubiquinone/menaquinone biosynthesis C-methylase UbiE